MLQKEILNALTTCPLIGKVVTIRYPFEKDEKSISIKRENVEVFDCHLSRVTRGSGNRRSILYPYKNEQCYDKGGVDMQVFPEIASGSSEAEVFCNRR